MSKKSLERLGRYTSQWFTHVGSWERPPAAVLKGCAGCIHLAHHYSVATVRTLAHSAPAAGVSHEARQLTLGLRSPAPLLAAAVRSPAHRRAARAGDIACSTHCRDLERLAWSSPPACSACRRHVPDSEASGHRLRVLRLQHYSVSVNMFCPLLRLPGPFSASFQCYSLTSRGYIG